VPTLHPAIISASKSTVRLYEYLREQAGRAGIVIVSLDTLAQALRVSTRTVARGTATLTELRLLTVVRLGDAYVFIVDPRKVPRRGRGVQILQARLLLSAQQAVELAQALGSLARGS
jgi:AraC-like DNA-binding protein